MDDMKFCSSPFFAVFQIIVMRQIIFPLLILALAMNAQIVIPVRGSVIVNAATTELTAGRVEVLNPEAEPKARRVALKAGEKSNVKDAAVDADLVFNITATEPGKYVINAVSGVGEEMIPVFKVAKSKWDSLFVKLQIDNGWEMQRVIFAPWNSPKGVNVKLGIFQLSGKPQRLKVWLPKGLHLESFAFSKHNPPKVPEPAEAYAMPIVPPKVHPRLWMTPDSVKTIRENLTKGENAEIWNYCKTEALRQYTYNPDPKKEAPYNYALEMLRRRKAFYYQMTGDKKVGREAIALTCKYMRQVSFGNYLDVTREIGRTIYYSAFVYDWCYELMTPEERDLIRTNMMRLADDMECGWPPFRQTIINGHGNEAQVNRDLLGMSIAIFDEDPIPYKYCAYQILEQLVPMRAYEYDSKRHNQGSNYGTARHVWDLHSAWMFRRMLGRPVYNDNIGGVHAYWLFARRPDSTLVTCGDCWLPYNKQWYNVTQPLLAYSYAHNPYYKYDCMRKFPKRGEYDVDFLLVNDPDLSATPPDDLPLTLDYGPRFGGMVTRTGWNFSENSPDVHAEIVGGGYNAGGHQHADAGAFQIFCHGELVSNLAQYRFYGTPYDWNYAKASISKSMLLVDQPGEKFERTITNNGGSRFTCHTALTPQELREKPLFQNGTVLYCGFGPSPQTPEFSCWAADLSSAYSDKIKSYVRHFSFINLKDKVHPAVAVVLDELQTSNPTYKRHWQLCTRAKPAIKGNGLHLETAEQKSCLDMQMLLPQDCDITLLSGKDTLKVDGKQFEAPYSDDASLGHRIGFTPKGDNDHTTFLAVMQIGEGIPQALDYAYWETDNGFVLLIASHLLFLPKGSKLLDSPVTLEIPQTAGNVNVCLAGLAPGKWNLHSPDGKTSVLTVPEDKGTAFFRAASGTWKITR